MSKSKLARVTLTLSPAVQADLSYVSYRLGVTKSTLVDGMLSEPIGTMRDFLVDLRVPLGDLSGPERAEAHQRLAAALDAALEAGAAVRDSVLSSGGSNG